MCQINSCVYCAPIMAWEVGAAIALARPDQFVTLTKTPPTWAETRRCLQSMRQRMLRPHRGYVFEWAFTRELTHDGAPHIHAWVHGDRLPQPEDWDREASLSGLGHSHVAPVTLRRSLYYGLKMLIEAAELPEIEAQDRIDDFLTLNHGRLVHPSRAFWRDHRGRSLDTRERAIQVALGRDLDQPQWVVALEEMIGAVQARLHAEALLRGSWHLPR
jgi:hypothetical protein